MSLEPTVDVGVGGNVNHHFINLISWFYQMYGYNPRFPRRERWRALRKAVKELGPVLVLEILTQYLHVVEGEKGKEIIRTDLSFVRKIAVEG